ncbi:cytochrome c oxidase subunit II [Benzoatithermus flavus]|uniref:cytochrome-c oxidase n=1 Tax=Benzoatithermus flavus TaxID=3108223 RepID=A0ABU8XU83_9PROT
MALAPVELWPASASAYAREIDRLIWSYTGLILFLAVPIIACLVVFAIRYRRGSDADRSNPPVHGLRLELAWTGLPFLATLVFYFWAADLYSRQWVPPKDTLDIAIVAEQWMFKAEHPGGQREIDELHVPAGRPVRLVMTSQDVIHSFYLPALRLKQDVLPGRYTTLWFEADTPGTYALRCAEYCGSEHSAMGGRFVVLSPKDYAAWLATFSVDRTLAQEGEALFRRLGCSGCHGARSVARAPSLAGISGKPQPLADGSIVIADEQYVRDSILQPKRQVVAGFAPIMPSFEGQIGEEDLVRLVAYVKSLADASAEAAPPGAAVEPPR